MAPADETMRVTLDGLGEYDVPANDQRWNGFAVPGFTMSQVREIAAALDRFNLAVGSDEIETITIGDDGIVTLHTTSTYDTDTDADAEIETETIEPNPRDGLYYVGGFRWAWEIA